MKKMIAAAFMAALISGCASSAKDESAQIAEEGTAPREAVSERLDRLERGLAELQIEFSRISPSLADGVGGEHTSEGVAGLTASTHSNQHHKGHNQEQTAASPSNESMPTIAPSTQPSADLFSVHLASYREDGLTQEGWQKLRSQFPNILGPLTALQSKVELQDRGEFHRLKAGPFSSWRDAETVCGALRQSGQNCTVMDFTGEPLAGP